ncbi:MAG: (2Fe-2S)-binding protein [Phycisphaeraceae bacterium]|nr:(2Fe-2S)-binding protein [Phycisphaeraceae bacterium]
MPRITINGVEREFTQGQMILQVANDAGVEIPQYCYHDGLSIVASCRICLAEVWMPNPRNNNALEPWMGGKLVPTCQTAAADGMVVYTDSPKSVQNQKSVMEYLLINHPLDCPVCDKAGECGLQDYSYEYGRAASRFQDVKVKNPKKDIGPNILLYSDRCIMCTRCVRFTREVTGTSELMVQGRGNHEEIDVFPGRPIANELSLNVTDLCPVGALLDKDFLFAQRVWFLKETPSIDGFTASGDNLTVCHNEGKVYRLRPRTNMAVNKWWITDEVRHSWKWVHSEDRLTTPVRRQFGVQVETDWNRALLDAVAGLKQAVTAKGPMDKGARLGLLVSPMLSCEDAYLLARAALAITPSVVMAVGPVPSRGQDKTFPPSDSNGFKMYAEKAPNARGVRRVLDAIAQTPGASLVSFDEFVSLLRGGIGGAIITGNYPSDWAPKTLVDKLGQSADGPFVVLIDSLKGHGYLAGRADIVLPSSSWLEKAGTFQNARDMLQSFEQAIAPIDGTLPEAQIAIDLAALAASPTAEIPPPREGLPNLGGESDADRLPQDAIDLQNDPAVHRRPSRAVRSRLYNAAMTRQQMAKAIPSLSVFVSEVAPPPPLAQAEPEMQVVEL